MAEDGPQQLLVEIVSAKGLYNADGGWMSGKSDPYCTCEHVGHSKSKLKTHVIDDELDPVWNYSGIYHQFSRGDQLKFEVFDKDMMSSTSLGSAVLIGEDFFWAGGIEADLPLVGHKKAQGSLRVRIFVEPDDFPDSHPYAEHVWTQGPLHSGRYKAVVFIVAARDLRNADGGCLSGKSDPYCTCHAVGYPKSKLKTKTIKDNLDPVWDYICVFHNFQEHDQLEFEVLDKDLIRSTSLGCVVVKGEDFWRSGMQGELLLHGKRASGVLGVKIITMPEDLEFLEKDLSSEHVLYPPRYRYPPEHPPAEEPEAPPAAIRYGDGSQSLYDMRAFARRSVPLPVVADALDEQDDAGDMTFGGGGDETLLLGAAGEAGEADEAALLETGDDAGAAAVWEGGDERDEAPVLVVQTADAHFPVLAAPAPANGGKPDEQGGLAAHVKVRCRRCPYARNDAEWYRDKVAPVDWNFCCTGCRVSNGQRHGKHCQRELVDAR